MGTLKPLVQEKLDELRRTIDLYRLRGGDAALAVVLTDDGKDVMDKIRQICAEIETVANNRVSRQSEAALGAARRTRAINTVGNALLLALLILATATIHRAAIRRQRLTEALRYSEERTRLIVETALDAVITVDGNGVVTGWNSQAEATLGWTAAQAIGKALQPTIIPPRNQEKDVLGLRRDRMTQQAGKLAQRIEITALHRDGREFPAEIGSVAIQMAEHKLQAQLTRIGLLNRITRSVGERQDLKSIFQVVIRGLEDQLPIDFDCLCLYDAKGRSSSITSVGVKSETLCLDLALTEQAQIAVDRNGLDRCVGGQLVYEPDIGSAESPFLGRLAQGELRSLVMAPLLLEKDVFGVLVAARRQPNGFSSGDCEFLRQLSEHVALATHEAQIRASLQQAYDDLKQTQQAMLDQERLRILGQMASGIAHDIHNALSPMTVYTDLLLRREPNLSAGVHEYLEVAQRSVDDVVHTVTRLREFSRRREPQLTLTPVHLNRLVEQVLDLTCVRWSNMPQQRGVVIQSRTELAPDRPAVIGIESEIREALINLVFNAVDAMPLGGTLTLRTRMGHCERTSAPSHSVHVEVQDTGLGMDKETRRRCLEPFLTTKGERGTGLGLAMVFGIARRHDAEIDIDSGPGRGTTVCLSFPEAALEELPPPLVNAPPPPRDILPLHILLVDDDPLIIRVLRAALEFDGHVVATANGGQAGIDAFRLAESGKRFDVVITDLGMPNVDGHKVASAVKATRSSALVILLTGWGQQLAEDGEMPLYVDRIMNNSGIIFRGAATGGRPISKPAGPGSESPMTAEGTLRNSSLEKLFKLASSPPENNRDNNLHKPRPSSYLEAW